MSVNNTKVIKIVTFKDGKFSVFVRDKSIDLEELMIDNKYECSKHGISIVCNLVKSLLLCEGLYIDSRNIKYEENYLIESIVSSGVEKKILRSNNCKQVVSYTYQAKQHCYPCKRQNLEYSDPPEPEKSDYEKSKEMMPNASETLMSLIMSQ
ncbi:hypothetical protein ACF0H5_005869 [Mactra antiquata]